MDCIPVGMSVPTGICALFRILFRYYSRSLTERCRQGISFELDPASVSELAINAWQERTIVRLNDTRHLQE